MLWELLVFGGFWFWLFCLVAVIAIAYKAVQDESSEATGFVVLFVILFSLFGDRDVLRWFVAHPVWILAICGGYIVAGLIVSYTKWRFYSHAHRLKYDQIKLEFFRDNNIHGSTRDNVPYDLIPKWKAYLADRYTLDNLRSKFNEGRRSVVTMNSIIPQMLEHKGLVVGWMSYWPIHLIWSLTHDMIKHLWEEMYKLFRHVYQHTANRAFRGIEQDIQTEEKRNESR